MGNANRLFFWRERADAAASGYRRSGINAGPTPAMTGFTPAPWRLQWKAICSWRWRSPAERLHALRHRCRGDLFDPAGARLRAVAYRTHPQHQRAGSSFDEIKGYPRHPLRESILPIRVILQQDPRGNTLY